MSPSEVGVRTSQKPTQNQSKISERETQLRRIDFGLLEFELPRTLRALNSQFPNRKYANVRASEVGLEHNPARRSLDLPNGKSFGVRSSALNKTSARELTNLQILNGEPSDSELCQTTL